MVSIHSLEMKLISWKYLTLRGNDLVWPLN